MQEHDDARAGIRHVGGRDGTAADTNAQRLGQGALLALQDVADQPVDRGDQRSTARRDGDRRPAGEGERGDAAECRRTQAQPAVHAPRNLVVDPARRRRARPGRSERAIGDRPVDLPDARGSATELVERQARQRGELAGTLTLGRDR